MDNKAAIKPELWSWAGCYLIHQVVIGYNIHGSNLLSNWSDTYMTGLEQILKAQHVTWSCSNTCGSYSCYNEVCGQVCNFSLNGKKAIFPMDRERENWGLFYWWFCMLLRHHPAKISTCGKELKERLRSEGNQKAAAAGVEWRGQVPAQQAAELGLLATWLWFQGWRFK